MFLVFKQIGWKDNYSTTPSKLDLSWEEGSELFVSELYLLGAVEWLLTETIDLF